MSNIYMQIDGTILSGNIAKHLHTCMHVCVCHCWQFLTDFQDNLEAATATTNYTRLAGSFGTTTTTKSRVKRTKCVCTCST